MVEVQCDVGGGLPAFHIVGLPDKEVSESRERIRSAIKNSGFQFPPGRVTANLAPADLRKEGVGFDLPIALAVLIATQQATLSGGGFLAVGELALDGSVRSVRGTLAIAMRAEGSVVGVIVPEGNAQEAAVGTTAPVTAVRTLVEAQQFLSGRLSIAPTVVSQDALKPVAQGHPGRDLAEVRGQVQAKRALEIAAAGGHNLLMVGPPGSGKSMLASCLPGLLPELTFDEALEVTRVYSSCGRLEDGQAMVWHRPYRAPHHTVSYAGMVGGGRGVPGPGEISLAHHGVLFLDELPEFDRRVLETLRQPLEDRSILISRAGIAVRYPASFMLVAAMNPCACGHLGDAGRACTCGSMDLQRYRKRLSGPFLDRIDLCVEVPRVEVEDLLARQSLEGTLSVRERVVAARRRQQHRTGDHGRHATNAHLDGEMLRDHCHLGPRAEQLLRRASVRFAWSARAHVRMLRVARTIADLAGTDVITEHHIAEAVQFRTTRVFDEQ
ncbi:MAG TPA: ATP-binding protein [Candidatus Acetothermia bacterium]|nr:ATP-binding protein [Candidatus Acetothermia bacterium]